MNLFPEIKDHLINIFERYTHVLDAELQQRACEYLALARRDDGDDLLATIFDEMPVFPERESTLVNRLHSRGDAAQDKRTWIIGHSSDNKERAAERFNGFRKGTGDSISALSNVGSSQGVQPVAESSPSQPLSAPTRSLSTGMDTMMGTNSAGAADDIMSSLADLDLSSSAAPQEQPLLASATRAQSPPPMPAPAAPIAPQAPTNGNAGLAHAATLGGIAPSLLAPLNVAPNIEKVSRGRKVSLTNSGWNDLLTPTRECSTRMIRYKSA